MRPELLYAHLLTDEGRPAGGNTVGIGLDIRWQSGPMPNGVPNGAQVEDVLQAAKQRLEFFQFTVPDGMEMRPDPGGGRPWGPYACTENAAAIQAIDLALTMLYERTAERTARGVEGTYQP